MRWRRWFDVVRLRLCSLLRRAVQRELDRELQFHLDQEAKKNVRLRLTPGAARSAALQQLRAEHINNRLLTSTVTVAQNGQTATRRTFTYDFYNPGAAKTRLLQQLAPPPTML